MAELNQEHLETVRQLAFYRDRRIDAYEAITERSLLPEAEAFPCLLVGASRRPSSLLSNSGHDWPGKYGAIEWAFVEFILKVSASKRSLSW